MKLVFVILIIIISNPIFAAEVIPEPVLKSWGYQSTGTDENNQHIKLITGVRLSESQMYFPRFLLTKKCFQSSEVAIKNDKLFYEKINYASGKGVKAYYDSVVSKNCVFSISTGSNLTYLKYQPAIFKKYKAYLFGEKAP